MIPGKKCPGFFIGIVRKDHRENGGLFFVGKENLFFPVQILDEQ